MNSILPWWLDFSSYFVKLDPSYNLLFKCGCGKHHLFFPIEERLHRIRKLYQQGRRASMKAPPKAPPQTWVRWIRAFRATQGRKGGALRLLCLGIMDTVARLRRCIVGKVNSTRAFAEEFCRNCARLRAIAIAEVHSSRSSWQTISPSLLALRSGFQCVWIFFWSWSTSMCNVTVSHSIV